MDSGRQRFTHINFWSLCSVITILPIIFSPHLSSHSSNTWLFPLYQWSLFFLSTAAQSSDVPSVFMVSSQLPSLSIHTCFCPRLLPPLIFCHKPLRVSQCLCLICLVDCSGLPFWPQSALPSEVQFSAGIWFAADPSPSLLPSLYFSFDLIATSISSPFLIALSSMFFSSDHSLLTSPQFFL